MLSIPQASPIVKSIDTPKIVSRGIRGKNFISLALMKCLFLSFLINVKGGTTALESDPLKRKIYFCCLCQNMMIQAMKYAKLMPEQSLSFGSASDQLHQQQGGRYERSFLRRTQGVQYW